MRNILCVATLLFTSICLSQNDGVISGNIIDIEMINEPLMFAQVEIQDTNWRTKTNLNGNFEITGVTPGSYTLAISFSGYETKTLPIEVAAHGNLAIQEGLTAKSIDVGTFLNLEVTEIQESDGQTSLLDGGFKRNEAFEN